MDSIEDLLIQKEKHLETLLNEGKQYSVITEELYNSLKKDTHEYKKMLFVMDRYSRYKIQLREDMEELKEMYDDDILSDPVDEDTEDANEIEYIEIEVERYEDENIDFLFEEQCRYFQNIVERKNILANMEMVILKMLNMDGTFINFQLSVHSKLKSVLIKYCETVRAFLKHNEMLTRSLDGFENKKLIKSIQDKYKQLQQLLINFTEKQTFFSQIAKQPFASKQNKEENNT